MAFPLPLLSGVSRKMRWRRILSAARRAGFAIKHVAGWMRRHGGGYDVPPSFGACSKRVLRRPRLQDAV